MASPSASYSFTIRVVLPSAPGSFAQIAAAIGAAGGDLGAIDLVRAGPEGTVRDVTVNAGDSDHGKQIVDAVRALPGVDVQSVSDRTFLLHLGGKIEVVSKSPIRTRDDLSMAYTPGVARVCLAIADAPERAWSLTIKRNTVAVVSDGTAVLGLGDIGPEAAMPVMEGKAMLFKEFGGVDAFPICLATKDVDEIVRTVKALAPGFGGINLEDISAPRCFEIERRLREELDIPVFHDDQHGTAVVVLAAFLNSLRLVGKRPEDVKVVMIGAGAAGVACTKMLLAAGVRADRRRRPRRAPSIAAAAASTRRSRGTPSNTNPGGFTGTADEALRGADVFIGLSGPGAVSVDAVLAMADDAIVFAMANPTPEVPPEALAGRVAVIATGRSDYPNQINNVLAFPGIFRGALDVRASEINEEMKLAAGEALASVVTADELSAEYVIPSVFNRDVATVIAEAVAQAADATAASRARDTLARARRPRPSSTPEHGARSERPR